MDIDLIHKMTDYGIIGLLGIMSFVSVWLWIERMMFYKKNRLKKNTTQKKSLKSTLQTISTP